MPLAGAIVVPILRGRSRETENTMGRSTWIILALVAVGMITAMYMADSGQLERPWAQCKESMVTQIFTDQCTPRDGFLRAPEPDGTAAPDQPPVDDGVGKVDRGQ